MLLQLTVQKSSLAADLEIAKAFKQVLDDTATSHSRKRFFLNLLINVFLEKHEPLTYQELEAMIKMEEIFDFSNNRLVHDIARHTIAPKIAKEMAEEMAEEIIRAKQLAELPALRRFGLTDEQIAEVLQLSLQDVQSAR